MAKTVEFRGCDNLVIAEIISDDINGYTVGAVTSLAPVAEISKTVESSSETHYYDNTGMITIRSEGTDEVTLTVPALPLATLATITGKTIDPTTGAYLDNEGTEKRYALGYRLKLTDGTYRYVWRLNGVFSNIPDETSTTESDSVDTNNQEVVYTGSKSVYEFENGGRTKAVVIDERDGLVNVSQFFTMVRTPDNIGSIAAVTGITVSPTTASVQVGKTTTVTATPTTTGTNSFTPEITWSTSAPTIATVDSTGVVTGVATGTATITATVAGFDGECDVTVTTA